MQDTIGEVLLNFPLLAMFVDIAEIRYLQT